MKDRITTALAAIIVLLAAAGGCQVAPYEVVNIEITQFEDFEANLQLADEIVRYDRRYLAAKVPTYNDSFSEHIAFGTGGDSLGIKRVFVWIRYDYKNSEIIANKVKLKEEMRDYFTNLAASHARMYPVFKELESHGTDWIDTAFSGESDFKYSDFGPKLRATLLPVEWQAYCAETRQQFGRVSEIEYIGAQFHESINSEPDMISLFYLVSTETGKKVNVRVSELNEESGVWLIEGFGFTY